MGITAVWKNSRELLEVLPKVVFSALIHSVVNHGLETLNEFVERFVRNLKMKLSPVMRLGKLEREALSLLGLHTILNYWLAVRG